MLFLRAPKQRDHRRGLRPSGYLPICSLAQFSLSVEGEAFGLFFVEAANSHEVSLSLTGKRRTLAPIP
jgi:hypothetical protein